MNNIYVRLNNRKYRSKYDKLFHGLRIENIDAGKIVLLPRTYLKRRSKYTKIIEKNIGANEYVLYSKDVESLTHQAKSFSGKKIMKCMVRDIIEYLFSILNGQSLLEDVYILVNECTSENYELIEDLAHAFRSINIVTSKVSKFRRLEQRFERKGFLITISNNKRKSLQRARNIVNIDFDNKYMHKYIISSDAIIINLNTEKIHLVQNYNGIIINDCNISIDRNLHIYFDEYYGEFEPKILLESFVNNYTYNSIKKYLKECKAQINQLVGIEEFITEQEIKKHYKNSL